MTKLARLAPVGIACTLLFSAVAPAGTAAGTAASKNEVEIRRPADFETGKAALDLKP